MTVNLKFIPGIVLLISLSCSGLKPRAEGVQNEIIVFVSDDDKKELEPILKSIFNKTIFTPQPEYVFDLKYRSFEEFSDRKRGYNIVVAALLDNIDDTVDKLVRKLLPRSQYKMIIENKNHVFTKRDVFASGQVLAVIAGNNTDELTIGIQEKKQLIYDEFDDVFLKREKKVIFKKMEQKKLSRQFEKKYGWKLRIQHDYQIIREDSSNNFIWLGRAFPYRWISIHWVDDASGITVNEESVKKINSRYPQQYYGEIKFLTKYLEVEQTFFNEWPAWKISGLWEHNIKLQGGPFISYIFYDGISDRLFHINILIHNPGKPKIVLLRHMEIIAHTFAVREE